MSRTASGLRERKRAAAMHRIQVAAVDLFDAHGFDHVTVEQVAAAAHVSPSSIYRYFGTKEALVIRDEHDDTLMSSLARHLRDHDIYEATALALDDISEEHFVRDAELTARRTRYYFEVPSVRAAWLMTIDQTRQALAEALTARRTAPQRTPTECHVIAASLVWALYTAVEQWYLAGAHEPLGPALRKALGAIHPQEDSHG